MTPLVQLEERLQYSFRDSEWLQRAVTHSSYLPEHPESGESNQRLEYLGDAVLQLILTEALFQLFPSEREGVLSKRRAVLAKGVSLVELARELQLDECMRLGTSEESSGGRQRASTMEDAFEALIGAIYLDSDFATVRTVVLRLYGDIEARLRSREQDENPKGRLQEWIQPQHGNHALRYEVVAVTGEDHERAFEVAVFLHDRELGQGRGSSKKTAEEAAARVALEKLRNETGES